jgi:hypothetical protein
MLATHSLPLETQQSLLCFLKAADASAFKQTLQSADSFNMDAILDVQEPAYKNYNLLACALLEQNHEIIEFLLQLGANINAIDSEGSTILHNFAVQNKSDALLLAYLYGADFTIPNARGFNVINHIREQLFRYKWFAPSRIKPLQTILRLFESRWKLEVLFILRHSCYSRLSKNLQKLIVIEYL